MYCILYKSIQPSTPLPINWGGGGEGGRKGGREGGRLDILGKLGGEMVLHGSGMVWYIYIFPGREVCISAFCFLVELMHTMTLSLA